jgi:thioredoxin-like negative regulator of GroEL
MTTSVLSRLSEIRESYARRRNLRRELSVYTTANDLNDIDAAIARSADAETDPETQEIRRFLAVQRMVSQHA